MVDPHGEYKSLLAKACSAPFDAEELERGLANACKSLPGSHASLRTTRRGSVYGARKEPLTALFVTDPTLKVAVEGATSAEDKLRILREYSVWIQSGAVIGAPRPWLKERLHIEDDDCTVLGDPEPDLSVIKEVVDLDSWGPVAPQRKRPCIVKQEDIEVDALPGFPLQPATECGSTMRMGAPKTPPQSIRSLEEDVQMAEIPSHSGHHLIGCRLTKQFGGRLYEGEVWGYDRIHKYYEIVYDDGDREELEWGELWPLLLSRLQQEEARHRTEMEARRMELMQQETIHSKEVEDLKVRHAEELQRRQQRHAKDLLQLKRVEKELMQERADGRIRIADLQTTLNSLQEGKRQIEAEQENLRQSLQVAVATSERYAKDCVAHRQEIEGLKLEHLEEVAGLKLQNEAFRQEIEGLILKHLEEVAGLKLQHVTVMRQLEQERLVRAEMEGLKLAHVREMKGVRAEHLTEVKGLKVQHVAAMKEVKQENAWEIHVLKLEHVREIDSLRQECLAEVEGLKREWLAEVASLKLQHEAAMQQQRQERARKAEAETLRKQEIALQREMAHKEEVEALRVRHLAEVELQREIASSLSRQHWLREELEAERTSEMAAIAVLEAILHTFQKEKICSETEQWALPEALQEVGAALKKEMEAMKLRQVQEDNSHRVQLLRQESEHGSKLEALRNQLEKALCVEMDALKKGHRAEVQDLRRQQMEFQRLGEQLESLREVQLQVENSTGESEAWRAKVETLGCVLLEAVRLQIVLEDTRKAEMEGLKLQQVQRENALREEIRVLEKAQRVKEIQNENAQKAVVESLWRRHEAAIESLRRQQLEQESAQRGEMDALRQKLLSQGSSHKAEVRSLLIVHKTEVENLRNVHKAEVEVLRLRHGEQKDVYRKEVEDVESSWRVQVEGLKAEHADAMRRLVEERAVKAEAEALRRQESAMQRESVRRAEMEALKVRHLAEVQQLEQKIASILLQQQRLREELEEERSRGMEHKASCIGVQSRHF